MDMNSKYQILAALINESRYLQSGIRDGMDAASAAALRGTLTWMLRELESGEREAYTLADSLGLHTDGLPPLSRLLTGGVFRVKLHFRCTDSFVAELLIRRITESMIRVQREVNRAEDSPGPATDLLLHRFQCCTYGSVRNLQPFL